MSQTQSPADRQKNTAWLLRRACEQVTAADTAGFDPDAATTGRPKLLLTADALQKLAMACFTLSDIMLLGHRVPGDPDPVLAVQSASRLLLHQPNCPGHPGESV